MWLNVEERREIRGDLMGFSCWKSRDRQYWMENKIEIETILIKKKGEDEDFVYWLKEEDFRKI